MGNAGSDTQVIGTQTAKIWLSAEGIIFLVYKPQVEVTLERIQENITALTEASRGQKRPILADIHNMRSADRNVREQSQQLGHIAKSATIVASSPTTVMLGNLFTLINKPPFPTRLFRTEAEEIEWLKGFFGMNAGPDKSGVAHGK